MHSQRQVVATLVSSIISQVLAILLLLPSSLISSSSSSSSSSSPFFSSLLFRRLSVLLLFLTTTTSSSSSDISSSPSSSSSSSSSSYSSSSSSFHSPPSPSPSRKRKRGRLQFENNYSNGRSQQQQTPRLQQEEEQERGLCSLSSSSSSSLSSICKRDEANCKASSALLPLSEDPSSFNLCFRMTSATFEWLSGLLEPLLECRDPVGSSLNLSPHLRLGIGLFRLATGSPYPDISRRFSVSESTARFCTKQLCRVLCTNFRFWVAFPNPSELQSVSTAFQSLSGFPNCCGAIECARFEILGGERIATQIVVEPSSRILNVATGFRGSKDDFAVLQASTLYKDVQGGHLLASSPAYLEGVAIPQYLIGAQAYPLLPWLMVPFVQPTNASSEDDFNAIHSSMHAPALRALASLRNWGILSRPIEEEEVNMAVACIGACSILHNVLLMREDFSALSGDTDDHLLQDWRESHHGSGLAECSTGMASAVRNALAARARELSANLIQRN